MNIKVMLGATGMLVILAAAALGWNWYAGSPSGTGRVGTQLLDAGNLQGITEITLENEKERATLKPSDSGWIVVEQEGFDADAAKLGAFLLKLGNEKIASKITENAEKLADLGLLTAEENGGKREKDKTGTLFSVKREGKPDYQLLIGKDRTMSGGSGLPRYGGKYVRFPESKAAYLVGTDTFFDASPKEWIRTQVFGSDDHNLIREVRIRRKSKPELVVFRENKESSWRIKGVDADKLDLDEVQKLGNNFAGTDIVHIAPANAKPAELGRKQVGVAAAHYFDGRIYTLTIGEEKAGDNFRYIALSAALSAGVDDAALKEQVAAFNKRFGGRLVALYDWDGSRLLRERKDFLAKQKQ